MSARVAKSPRPGATSLASCGSSGGRQILLRVFVDLLRHDRNRLENCVAVGLIGVRIPAAFHQVDHKARIFDPVYQPALIKTHLTGRFWPLVRSGPRRGAAPLQAAHDAASHQKRPVKWVFINAGWYNSSRAYFARCGRVGGDSYSSGMTPSSGSCLFRRGCGGPSRG